MKFIKPIFLGIIAAGGALVFELLISGFLPENNFSEAALSLNIIIFLIIAAAVEEFFKLLVIYKNFFLPQKDSSDNGRKIIFFSLFLGLGFALAEITFSDYSGISGDPCLYSGMLGIVFIHSFSAGLIGWLLLKIKKASFFPLAFILFTATLFHFAYNAAIIAGYLQK